MNIPYDIWGKVFTGLDSYTRALICPVSKTFAIVSVLTSKIIANVPKVYDQDHKLTVNELGVVVESGDYHAFVRNQASIREIGGRLYTSNKAGNDHILYTAFDHGDLGFIIPLINCGFVITRSHIGKWMHNTVFMNHLMTHGDIMHKYLLPLVVIDTTDNNLLIECLQYACQYGYLENVKIIIGQLNVNEVYYYANDMLEIACTNNHGAICDLLITSCARSAYECYNRQCPGHWQLSRDRCGVERIRTRYD